jgi:hypothetical protein
MVKDRNAGLLPAEWSLTAGASHTAMPDDEILAAILRPNYGFFMNIRNRPDRLFFSVPERGINRSSHKNMCHSSIRLNLSALVMTETELSDMAAAAMTGLKVMPKRG